MIIATLILIVGYLLLSASSSVLDTLSGRTWSGSLTELAGSGARDTRRKWLGERIDQGNLGTERNERASWRKRTRHAPEGTHSAPTALGDVLLAADGHVNTRYGVRLAALWEPLRAVVDPEKPAAVAVAEEKSSLDLMGNLTFVFGLFAFEAAILHTVWDRDGSVLLSLLGFVVAYVCYRVTVTKAVSWCDAIDTVVAFYRDDLLKEVRAREASDADDEKTLFAQLSEFMLFAESDAKVFKAATPAPALLCSDNVTAELEAAKARIPAEGTPAAEHRESIQYVLVATSKAGGWTSVSAQIVLADPRLPRIRSAPASSDGATASVIAGDRRKASDALLWRLQDLRRSEGVTLLFALDVWSVKVDQGLQVSVTLEDDRYRVEVSNPTDGEVTGASLHLFHTDDGPSKLVVIGGDDVFEAPPAVTGDTGTTRVLPLLPIAAGGAARFSFKLEPIESEAA